MTDIRIHDMADGRRIAFRLAEGAGPALVFLPGYKSDMSGGKACAVFDWAREQGRAALLMDYSGCGLSSGDFAEGCLSRWKEEVRTLTDAWLPGKALVLVGSSMGGWLMQLLALELSGRVAGLVGIAAAPDFADWGFTGEQEAELEAGRTIYEDNSYGPEPTPTHPLFWSDARLLSLLGRSEIPITCPVRLIHGQADPDVPWEVSLKTAALLRSADVQVVLVKDGDHRLSRDEDIGLLLRTIAALPAETK
jgi:pimeloyl-ACP methyl ester carboxylesterase